MLKREIGKWDLILLILNATIGAGILGLPSAIYRIVGVYSIFAVMICGVLVVVIGLTFSGVARRFDATGGPYLYTLVAFGKTPAFLMGWTMLVSRLFTFAALMNLLLSYFNADKLSPWIRPPFIIAFTCLIALVNYLGIKKSTVFNNFLSGFKIMSLLGFILTGVFFLKESNFRHSATVPSIEQFSSAALLLIFSFTGFEAALVASGEVKKPKKAIGFALICSLLTVATIYSFVQTVCIGTLDSLYTSQAPLKDSMELVLGPAGARWMEIVALFGISGTLHVSILVGSRLLYSMAENNQLPSVLARVHKKFRTPHLAIILFAVSASIISVSGTFIGAATISALAKLTIFLTMGMALLKFIAQDEKKSGTTARYARILAVASMIISLWLFYFSEFNDLMLFVITLLAGVIVMLGYRIFSNKP